MNREELAEFAQREGRRQIKGIGLTVIVILLCVTGLFFLIDRMDRVGNSPQSTILFSVCAALPLILLVAMSSRIFRAMPKCPHCGIRLYREFLAVAVATGRCGHCGKSVES